MPMKKKILLIFVIAALAATVVTAAACGNGTPAQSVLFNSAFEVWGKDDGKETLTYDVLRGEDVIGTFEMTGECVSGASLTVGADAVENANGIYFTSLLQVSETIDGKTVSTTTQTQTLLDTGFKVQKSYRKTVTQTGEESVTKEISGSYTDDDYTYSYKVNGEEMKTGEVSHDNFSSSAYVDNDFIYQVARLVAGSGLAFDVPYYNYDENGDLSTVTMENVSAAVTATNAAIKDLRGDFTGSDTKIYYGTQLSISLTRDFPGSGTSFSCHVISSVTENEKNTALLYALPAKITEDDITYVLTKETRD